MSTTYKYTYALSVGPIISTIKSARKTREVWGASYLFSELVKRLANCFDHKGDKLISPILLDAHRPEPKDQHKGTVSVLRPPAGAGIYPDIIIWNSNRDVTTVSTDILTTVKDLQRSLNAGVEKADNKRLNLLSLLCLPLFQLDTKEQGFNYIITAGHLAIQEETSSPLVSEHSWWSQEEKEDPDSDSQGEDKTKTKSRHWVNKLLGLALDAPSEAGVIGQRLRSLLEVSAIELAGENYAPKSHAIAVPIYAQTAAPSFPSLYYLIQTSKDRERLHTTLRTAFSQDEFVKGGQHNVKPKDLWRMRHKYLAVVHGDGDKIGKEIIGAFGHDPTKVKQISEALAQYSAWSANEVAAYGGQPIYMGGDDLFFFAPLVSVSAYNMKSFALDEAKTTNPSYQKEGSKLRITLLELLKHLSTGFSESMGKLIKELDETSSTQASTSFGVHVMHYKQPLDQAIVSAYNLLVGSAKKRAVRPAAAFRLELHSNAPSAIATLDLNGETYASTLMLAALAVDNTSKLDSYFSGLQHRITSYLAQHVWAQGQQISVRPFFERAIRKQGEGEPDNITESFYELLSNVLKQKKLEIKSGTLESSLQYKNRLAHELQFALKFTHLLQRKDIGHGRR